MRQEIINALIDKIHKKHFSDESPIFCFTSDIDWASEDVLQEYFFLVNPLNLKLTLYVTNQSDIIESNFRSGKIERGIHPNFLPGSSHGNSFKEVVETCIKFAPEAYGFRCHRAFEVTDVTHLLKNEYGYKYVSHQITILQPYIRPILHESGLINFPVFFEDGTHLYNQLDFNFRNYIDLFTLPGIKIISFHPMNFVFNSPSLSFMRSIKDSLTREEYQNISAETIAKHKHNEIGIRNTMLEMVNYIMQKNYRIMSMNELYDNIVNS